MAYKSQTVEVVKAHAAQCSNHYEIREIAKIARSAVLVEDSQQLDKSLLGFRPLFMGNKVGKDGSNLLSDSMYSLKELAILGRGRGHSVSSMKKTPV